VTEWPHELPFNISDNPEFENIANLLDVVGEGKLDNKELLFELYKRASARTNKPCMYVCSVQREHGNHLTHLRLSRTTNSLDELEFVPCTG
jgi:hypothetical protein